MVRYRYDPVAPLTFAAIEERIVAAREGLTERQRTLRTAIRSRVDALSRNCGALTPAWLRDDTGDAEIRAVLPSLGYTEIAPEWLWCERVAHAEIESVMRKVFAVAECVTSRELRAALAKHHEAAAVPHTAHGNCASGRAPARSRHTGWRLPQAGAAV